MQLANNSLNTQHANISSHTELANNSSNAQLANISSHTQLAIISFDEILDLTQLMFYIYISTRRPVLLDASRPILALIY